MCDKAQHIACSAPQCRPLVNNNETHLLLNRPEDTPEKFLTPTVQLL